MRGQDERIGEPQILEVGADPRRCQGSRTVEGRTEVVLSVLDAGQLAVRHGIGEAALERVHSIELPFLPCLPPAGIPRHRDVVVGGVPGRPAGSDALAWSKALTRGRDPHSLDRFHEARVEGRLGDGRVAGQQCKRNDGGAQGFPAKFNVLVSTWHFCKNSVKTIGDLAI